MDENANKTPPLTIPEEVQERARAAIQEAFGTFTEHIQQIADDFAEFDKRREATRRRMANGARRVDKRIV
jgi:histone H3/H4